MDIGFDIADSLRGCPHDLGDRQPSVVTDQDD